MENNIRKNRWNPRKNCFYPSYFVYVYEDMSEPEQIICEYLRDKLGIIGRSNQETSVIEQLNGGPERD